MKLIEVQPDQKQFYNHFVASQPGGSFLQAWEWGEWQKQLGKEVKRFFFYKTSDRPVLAAQFLLTPVAAKKNFLYAPFGPVMDQEQEFSLGDLEAFRSKLKEKFPETIFFRLEPREYRDTLFQTSRATANIQPAKTLVLDLRQEAETLLAQMHTKTRYNIRLAQKHGVEIQKEFALTVGHGLYTKEAIELILLTARRQGYVTHSRNYYKGLLDFFVLYHNFSDVRLHIYKAIFNKHLLAAAIMVDFGAARYFLFGGSSSEFKNVMAPYLLHYQAMMDAKADGLANYDFWGVETAGGQTPGFVRFKLGFGGQVEEFGGSRDFVENRLWYNVYTFVRKINRMGRKIFRHF